MENEIPEVEVSVQKLKMSIIKEYIWAVGSYFAMLLLAGPLFDLLIGNNKGIDGIGEALVIAYFIRILFCIVLVGFFIINPIRILIKNKKEIAETTPPFKKGLLIAVIILPVVLASFYVINTILRTYVFVKMLAH